CATSFGHSVFDSW
nr:immunoglobulin heavy chain junction region [Macaca mulatta]